MRIWYFCFIVAAAAGTTGMALGIFMGLSQDFSLTPVHAHINLLGWVSMMLYGLYYRGLRGPVGSLAWVQVSAATAGFAAMAGGLSLYLTDVGKPAKPIVVVGACLAIGSMLLFAAILLRNSRRSHKAASPGPNDGPLPNPRLF